MRRGCSERRMKMAAAAGRRSARRLLLGILVAVTFGRIAEAYDYTKSRQFLRNIAVSKHRDNTFWIPGFRWTQPKRSLEPRKRPRWESSQSDGGKRDEAKKSEWEKQMEEISRKEREKWKKFSTTTEMTEETLTNDDRMFEELTGLKKEEAVARKAENATVGGLENGRWGMTQRDSKPTGADGPRAENNDPTRSTTSSIEPPFEVPEESAGKDETDEGGKARSTAKLARISSIRAIVFGKNFEAESPKDYREERDPFDWASYLNYTVEHPRAGKSAAKRRRKGSWDVARISIETYQLPRDE